MVRSPAVGPKFETEKHLVEAFCSVLETPETPWGDVRIALEFFYHRGRTDVVALDCSSSILAFEAKLDNWRYALQQAYRNTCFAHLSYVVLPERTAHLASRHRYEFSRRAVGICLVNGRGIEVTVPARRQDPIQPWLTELACSRAQDAPCQ